MAASPAENILITSKFSYRPLEESNGIRLIHLLPASSAEAEVRCELIHTTLSNCTDIYEHYTALSYVWGDLIHAKTIWLDETPILVTHNLFSALRDLRSDSRPLRIWADAICINQQDDDEKLRKISMMGKIYSLADHTVIYLDLLNPQDAAKLDG
ncbi:HET domain containing protein [Hyaloscypha variabilis]